MASIKGTVSRVVSPTNFFVTPDDNSHATVDLEGHRVGAGEISVECHPGELAKGNGSKLRAWRRPLPKVGDKVELPIAGPGRGAVDEDLEPPTEDEIRAEAQRRVRAKAVRDDAEARVAAEVKRIEAERGTGSTG